MSITYWVPDETENDGDEKMKDQWLVDYIIGFVTTFDLVYLLYHL